MIEEIFVLNTKFETIGVIDDFVSLIWTSRYQDVGDFEIKVLANADLIQNVFVKGYYLLINGEQDVMIIDSIQEDTDIEEGNSLIITGTSLLSLLNRRIVWRQTTLNGNLQTELRRLLNENLIAPSDSKRRIPNFIFEMSTDSYITSQTISAQYTGDNLLDVVRDICIAYDLGARVILNSLNQFVFQLYHGSDRSFDQTTNPYVLFSPDMDNLISSSFASSNTEWKTVALVAGEGEGLERKTLELDLYEYDGINRRELFVDAKDLSSEREDQTVMSISEYNALLQQRGLENLAECMITEVHDGEVEETDQYVYGKDFFLGDIVQFENMYGIRFKTCVTEHILSISDSENRAYETFTPVS